MTSYAHIYILFSLYFFRQVIGALTSNVHVTLQKTSYNISAVHVWMSNILLFSASWVCVGVRGGDVTQHLHISFTVNMRFKQISNITSCLLRRGFKVDWTI